MRSIRSFANDDHHVMVKHSTIYPSPEELEVVQNMESTVECALRHVSDWMDEMSKSGKTEGDGDVKKDEAEENSAKDQDGWTLCEWFSCPYEIPNLSSSPLLILLANG
uniref:DZF domain-containing protein n=1 Tax=Monodelphis domestica TaxID=13616 RepID=A0A5F8H6Y0_MONDO